MKDIFYSVFGAIFNILASDLLCLIVSLLNLGFFVYDGDIICAIAAMLGFYLVGKNRLQETERQQRLRERALKFERDIDALAADQRDYLKNSYAYKTYLEYLKGKISLDKNEKSFYYNDKYMNNIPKV